MTRNRFLLLGAIVPGPFGLVMMVAPEMILSKPSGGLGSDSAVVAMLSTHHTAKAPDITSWLGSQPLTLKGQDNIDNL